jgi:filamentous hemagglutinin family protein
MKSNVALALAITVPLMSLVHSQSATAQVASDGSLSTTVNSTDGVNFTIENGDRADSNLFHSFREFSVPTGGSASFNNAVDVQNIFSRVTGSNVSNIDGLIRANGTANLFLLNPNGIIFGNNARLNLGGSFIATTANRIRFADGVEFGTTNLTTAPALTVSAPIGLQMGQNPGTIQVQGAGHNQIHPTSTSFPFDRSQNGRGLEGATGQTLGLIGGNIVLESGILTADSGHVELGAVRDSATPISLTSTASGWRFGYQGISNFGNIRLNERSLVDTSGLGSGSIQLQGRQIDLLNASTLLIQNFGVQDAGTMQLNASDTLTMQGNSLGGLAISELRTENLFSGRSGNIVINAPRLLLRDGAEIAARVFGPGGGGSVQVQASDRLELTGVAAGNPAVNSFLGTANYGPAAGAAGDVQIATNQIQMADGGIISSVSVGNSDGGNVTVTAQESINIFGATRFVFASSQISVLAFGAGDAGRLTINTARIKLTNGAQVLSSTLASGNAGVLTINASESIDVEGLLVEGSAPLASQIAAVSDLSSPATRQAFGIPPLPTGGSGNLNLNTPILRVINGGLVSVRNDSANGNAGNLRINADTVILNNQGAITAPALNGRGGDVRINVQNLRLNNNGQINASTVSGQGGDIQLNVRDRLQLTRQSTITADAQQSGNSGNIILRTGQTELNNSIISTNALGTANGGRLSLTSDRLQLLNGAQLSASTGGSGNAGSIGIQAAEIDISGVGSDLIPSLIGAGTLPNSSGQGGDLTVRGDRLRISNGGLISTGTAGTGTAGDVSIQASESIEVTGRSDRGAPSLGYRRNHPSRISASSLTDAPAGSVRIQTPVLTVDNGAIVEVSGAGSGGAGNLEVSADRINLSDRARLAAEVSGGDRGNITLNAGLIDLRRNSQITTNATGSASGGNINLNSQFILGLENSDIVARAQQGSGGRIAIATQGLIGLEPRLALTPESDINASSQVGLNGTINISNPNVDPESGVVELPTELVDASQQVAQVCGGAQDNQFVATGRGGVPVDPLQALGGDRAWSDLRNITREGSEVEENLPRTTLSNVLNEAIALTEASGWRVNGQGQVELVAVQHSVPNGFAAASCEAVL